MEERSDMTNNIIDGKQIASRVTEKVKERVESLKITRCYTWISSCFSW